MTWHQQNAIRRMYRLRHKKAHILNPDTLGANTLCGRSNPIVWIFPKHADNPANNVCKQCKNKLEKENLK